MRIPERRMIKTDQGLAVLVIAVMWMDVFHRAVA